MLIDQGKKAVSFFDFSSFIRPSCVVDSRHESLRLTRWEFRLLDFAVRAAQNSMSVRSFGYGHRELLRRSRDRIRLFLSSLVLLLRSPPLTSRRWYFLRFIFIFDSFTINKHCAAQFWPTKKDQKKVLFFLTFGAMSAVLFIAQDSQYNSYFVQSQSQSKATNLDPRWQWKCHML